MILADENILDSIIYSLRENGYEVFSVKESLRGADDISIAELSLNPPRIIVTEDKDFGEIAFQKKTTMTACILLRYLPFYETQITSVLLQFLQNNSLTTLSGKFVTITPDKIRITNI
jgi:predicted nuclease of predicted toxin-antitoxin system